MGSKGLTLGTVGVLLLVGVGLFLYIGQPPEKRTKPNPNMEPPPLPSALQEKVDALAGPVVDESPSLNQPVLDSAPPPVAIPEPAPPTLRPASISGLVRDKERNAIPGAALTLLVQDRTEPAGAAPIEYTDHTSQDGRYRIENIETFGDALLTAHAEGFTAQRTLSTQARPSSLLFEAVEPGMNYTFDFILAPVASVVAGRVVDAARAPIPGALVVVAAQQKSDLSNDGELADVSDADGLFHISLPVASPCVLHVRKEGYAFGHFPDIPEDSTALELMLHRGGTIAGVVTKGENWGKTGDSNQF